jgi:hypothetical protein
VILVDFQDHCSVRTKIGTKRTNMEKIEQIPRVWAPDCKYCQSQQMWGSTHESEIMDKARKMCTSPLFPDIVYSQLDTLDHAKATPQDQIRYLTKIHDLTNCSCLSKIIGQIQDRMHHTGSEQGESGHQAFNHLGDISTPYLVPCMQSPCTGLSVQLRPLICALGSTRRIA